MTGPAGSYAFGAFRDNAAELARLERQANVAWDLEERALRDAGLRPGHRVLDLACGAGFLSRRLADIAGPQGRVHGVDLSDDLLAVARRTVQPGSTTTFSRGNVYQLELPHGSFDFAYARLLFQHLEHPLRALAEVHRVLAPGGRLLVIDVDDALLVMDPEPPGLRPFMDMALRGQQRSGGDRLVGRKLPRYLKQAGFTSVRIDVVVVDSERISMQAFLDITTRFKEEQIVPAERDAAAAHLANIHEHALAPGVVGFVGVYAVSAQR